MMHPQSWKMARKSWSGKSELANQVSAAANQIENGKMGDYVGASELKTNMTMMTEAKRSWRGNSGTAAAL